MQGSRAIAAYWVATFRGTLDEAEVAVFDRVLAETEVEDAVAAIDEVAATGGYPPTPQRIAELAEGQRKRRARERIEHEHIALPASQWVRFAAFLRDNPDIAERVSNLTAENAGTKTNPTRAALGFLLKSGL
jgi:hypothetical protein